MNRLVWTPALSALFLIACNAPVPSVSKFEKSDTEKETTWSSSTSEPCVKPEVLAEPDAKRMRMSDLKRNFWGTYVLDEIHVYQRGETLDGQYIGSFYGHATRSADGSAGVELKMECSHQLKSSELKFRSGITVPVPSIVHPRSGRVTALDEGSAGDDDPTFNVPMIVDVHFDSRGYMSYKHMGASVGEAPFLRNRYLSDVLDVMSDDAKIYRRNDTDGFEIRFTRKEPKNLGTPDLFEATTEVVVTYQPDLN